MEDKAVIEVSGPVAERRVLQRVVLPVDRDLEVLKLYVENQAAREAEALRTPDSADRPDGGTGLDRAREPGALTGVRVLTDDLATAPEVDAGQADESIIRSRCSILVPTGRTISFCTYFNAFPAAYWRRWTSVSEVVLRLRMSGEATVTIHRSTAKGRIHKVESIRLATAAVGEASAAEGATGHGRVVALREVSLSLEPFIDGGWYWFEITAGESPAVLESAEWCADTPGARSGRTSIGITTFDRPGFCVDQLLALGDSPDVLDVIDEIFVVDQGTDRIEAHPEFGRAVDALGGRLRVIDQPNLGGSGGFARSMDETVRAGRSDYILLLDDDVVAETEGVLRAVAFADLATKPTIVGGHMFNLYLRSQLHAFAEGIEPYRWWWGPAMHTRPEHDFAVDGLGSTPWLHRRIDADYNGWWMCLIPVSVIKEIGLSMPMFIKWDDAEYCVRARESGFPTVSLPGTAVWHVPWQDKDDGIDWQAYFHWRNRIVTALTHSPYDRGGNLLKESLFVCAKHALAMQYSAAELMLMAIEDVLTGPEHMHAEIATKIKEIRAFRSGFPDARTESTAEEFPAVRNRRSSTGGRQTGIPTGRPAVLKSAAVNALKQLRPIDDAVRRNPQALIPHLDQHWSRLARFDSALVSSADGTRISWYQRDPKRFLSLMGRSSLLHTRLAREWSGLSERYRVATAELTSPEAWRRTFAAAQSERP